MSLTKLSLAGNNLILPGQRDSESLVSDIPAGDGKNDIFYSVIKAKVRSAQLGFASCAQLDT
jgi:hypothetical protein